MLQNIDFHIRGVSPLLCHNGKLADPLNEIAREMKKISGKRKKTDDDHAELSRLEWLGGLYLNDEGKPCIPGENIEATIVAAAKQSRSGPKAKSGVMIDGNPAIIYKGPTDLDKLWASGNFFNRKPMVVQRARIMRTRPCWRDWELKFAAAYNPEVLNAEDLVSWVETAGQLIGLGDSRPRNGRFVLVA